MPVARQDVGESAADRAGDQLVAHRPAVDIGILLQRIGAGEGRDRDMAGQSHVVAHGLDGDRIVGKVGAHHLRDAAQPPSGLSSVAGKSSVERSEPGQREAHGRKGDRDALDHVAGGRAFGALALHEFEAGRRCEEQVAHLDRGAAIGCRRPDGGNAAALDADLGGAVAGRQCASGSTAAPPSRSTAAPRRESRASGCRGYCRRVSRCSGGRSPAPAPVRGCPTRRR